MLGTRDLGYLAGGEHTVDVGNAAAGLKEGGYRYVIDVKAADGKAWLDRLVTLPSLVERILGREAEIVAIAKRYFKKRNFLFLGRGINYPIALEGALKLKEISYIHAEGYAAGEMKHGPIALIDRDMPVVVLAPRDRLYEKTVTLFAKFLG